VSVIVVGLEQRHAPLDLLEQVAVGDDALPKALAVLRGRPNLSEVVIVSTCLRTEIYAVVDRFHEGVDELQDFLADHAGVPAETLAERLVTRFDDDVAEHVFTVASGLDSAVLGESEVLGQVRRAWQKAQHERASGPVLGAMFRHALETGKRVRSETAIARGITSLSHGAVALAAERWNGTGGLAGSKVLVVGAGEMGEGLVRALADRAPAEIVVANRTPSRARSLVETVDGSGARHTGLGDLAGELAAADVVFTSVTTPEPVVTADVVGAATEGRAVDRPLLIVDLGVPRNVEPAAGSLPGVVLFDMDSLRAAVEEARSGRQAEVAQAREIVGDELERYRMATRARGAAPVVSALRAKVESTRQSELDRQRARRTDLTDEQWEQVDQVTRALVAKLLHDPTVAVKDAAGSLRGERLVEAVRTLFDL